MIKITEQEALYIVMPAYNEEDNIETVVRNWYPLLEGKSRASRLIIADAGSTDSTHDILLAMQRELPQLETLGDTSKKHGPKLIALYNNIIQRTGGGESYIFQTDSDGQTDPQDFAWFWDHRERYDAILGDRNSREDGASRVFVEKVVCFLLKIYFGVDIPDANAPFRLMKTSAVAKYMPRFSEDYELPNIMLATFFAYYHEDLLFKEVTFKSRRAGKNYINLPNIVKIGWRALKDFNDFRKSMRRGNLT